VKRPGINQLIDRGAVLKARIDADEWLGPKAITRIERFNLTAYIQRPDLSEGAGKPLVIIHESAIQLKNIH
jgi:hypothetical protein